MKEILFFTNSMRKRLLFKNFVLIEEENIVRSVYNLRRILLKWNIINIYLKEIFLFLLLGYVSDIYM